MCGTSVNVAVNLNAQRFKRLFSLGQHLPTADDVIREEFACRNDRHVRNHMAFPCSCWPDQAFAVSHLFHTRSWSACATVDKARS